MDLTLFKVGLFLQISFHKYGPLYFIDLLPCETVLIWGINKNYLDALVVYITMFLISKFK